MTTVIPIAGDHSCPTHGIDLGTAVVLVGRSARGIEVETVLCDDASGEVAPR